MRHTLLILLALCGTAEAQFNYVRNDQAICTGFACHSRMSAYGSCVAVAHWQGGTVFLSAGHNFEPDTPSHKIVRVTIGGASANLRRWWYRNPEVPNVDFAVLHLPGRLAELMPLASSPPEPGDRVSVSGFDFEGDEPKAIHFYGKVTTVESSRYGGLDFDFPVGVSGGPVTRQGELVGIVLHHDRYTRNRGGFQVNYDFRKSVLSLFPGAVFKEPETAPPPPEIEPVPDPISKSKAKAELAAKLKKAQEELAALKAAETEKPAETPVEKPVEKPVEQPPKKGLKEKASSAITIADTVVSNPWVSAAIVGGTGGTGAAGLAVWQLLMTRRRRKKKKVTWDPDKDMTQVEPSPIPNEAAVVSALRKRLAKAENKLAAPPQYIDVPVDHWNRAYAWAKRQMANDKFLNVKDHYFLQESLIKQYLTAMKTG